MEAAVELYLRKLPGPRGNIQGSPTLPGRARVGFSGLPAPSTRLPICGRHLSVSGSLGVLCVIVSSAAATSVGALCVDSSLELQLRYLRASYHHNSLSENARASPTRTFFDSPLARSFSICGGSAGRRSVSRRRAAWHTSHQLQPTFIFRISLNFRSLNSASGATGHGPGTVTWRFKCVRDPLLIMIFILTYASKQVL